MDARALICDERQQFTLADVKLRNPAPDQIAIRTHFSGVSIGTEFALIRNKLSWGPYPLCTGYMADAIEQAMGTEHHNMPIHYSREDSPLGTGGAIRNALPLAHSDPVLVINGDTLVDTELSVFIDRSTEESAAASLLLLPVGDVSRFGSVEIDGAGNITAFREKSESTAANGWVNAGIYLLTQDFISSIPDDQPVSIEREVFPAQTGNGLYGFQATGSFIDIGTPESYRLAEPFLKRLAQREDD